MHGASPLAMDPDGVVVHFFGKVVSLGRANNVAQLIGTRCAVLACLLSAWSVLDHLRRNASPQVRCHIIRILLLVPVYAVDAALGLERSPLEVPRTLLRETYEAYVLLSFMRLVVACDKAAAAAGVPGCHRDPADVKSMRRMQFGVWQYVVLCGMASPVVAFVAWLLGAYHVGSFEVTDAYLYCTTLQFVSQSYALLSVGRLLHHTRKELAPIRPVIKFMSIKALIFFTWIQSVAITVLEGMSSLGQISLWIEFDRDDVVSHWWDPLGVFNYVESVRGRHDAWKNHEVRNYVGSGLGSLVLCLEMLVFAFVHFRAWPCSEWDPQHTACSGYRLVSAGPAGVPLLGGDACNQRNGKCS